MKFGVRTLRPSGPHGDETPCRTGVWVRRRPETCSPNLPPAWSSSPPHEVDPLQIDAPPPAPLGRDTQDSRRHERSDHSSLLCQRQSVPRLTHHIRAREVQHERVRLHERLQALLRCPDLGLDPCLLIEQEVNISLPLGTFAHLLQPRTMAFYLVQQGLPLGVHAFVLLAESGEEVLALQPGHDGFGNRSIEVFFSHRDVKAAPPRYT